MAENRPGGDGFYHSLRKRGEEGALSGAQARGNLGRDYLPKRNARGAFRRKGAVLEYLSTDRRKKRQRISSLWGERRYKKKKTGQVLKRVTERHGKRKGHSSRETISSAKGTAEGGNPRGRPFFGKKSICENEGPGSLGGRKDPKTSGWVVQRN